MLKPEAEVVVAEEKPVEAPPSEEDKAAFTFQRLTPIYRNGLENLSKKGLKKLLMAIMEYPLHDVNLSAMSTEDRRMFEIGMKIFDAKYVIMRAVLSMKADEMEAALALKKTEGENNGKSLVESRDDSEGQRGQEQLSEGGRGSDSEQGSDSPSAQPA